jgi:S-DNA-T family DNA segregation ATPase FtsK/SpoIIIE
LAARSQSKRARAPKSEAPRSAAPEADTQSQEILEHPSNEVSKIVRTGRRHEVLGVIAAAITTMATLALASYDARSDDNWIGHSGTVIAGLLAAALGLGAWVVPAELGLMSIRLFQRRLDPIGAGRATSSLVLCLVGCSMAHLALPGELFMGGHLAGGWVGEVLGEILRASFGLVGAFVLGFTVLLVVLVLRTSLSLVELGLQLRGGAKKASFAAASSAKSVVDAFREARDIERREREEDELRARPRIVTSAGEERAPADLEVDESDESDEASDESVAQAPAPKGKSKRPPPRTVNEVAPTVTPAELSVALASEASEADVSLAEDGDDIVVMPKAIESAPVVKLAADPAPARAKKTEIKGPTIVPPKAEAIEVQSEPAVRHEPRRSIVKSKVPAFVLPPTELLDPPPPHVMDIDEKGLRENAARLTEKLAAYGVQGRVDEIHPGPVVTMYEMEPQAGTKVSKIAALSDDLAMALAAQKVRIVAPIPGKARVGFELPNKHRQMVALREILEDSRWVDTTSALPVAFGKDIAGQPVYGDLAKMPHLLVAGATGSGKSVGLNVMLASLLMKRTPEEVRLLMIDPKVVELAVFDGIPHMLLPVVTDMKKAALALRWAVDEMERRYQLFADAGARNIVTYNERVEKVIAGEMAPEKLCPKKHKKQVAYGVDGEEVLVDPVDGESADAIPMPTKLPYVVVVVDEFADLMMVAAKDIEAAIARLAQKARAAGIHVILATQRPSVDVITGMIKANFPARIAFKVSQREDSKTILGRNGAEHLLGHGDMLMIPPGASDLKRVHCAYISENEVQLLCDHLRAQGTPVYDENIVKPRDEDEEGGMPAESGGSGGGAEGDLYDRAVAIVATAGYCSISHLQRQLSLGYNRAAKLVEKMEKDGVVGPSNGKAGGRREVLVQTM